MHWRRLGARLLAPLLVLLAVGSLWQARPEHRAALYRLYRDYGRTRAMQHLVGYRRIESERFALFLTESDLDVADMVLETAEVSYDLVIDQLGYQPEGRVPLILYPDRDALRGDLGWGAGESALGVYWQGTIRLLSPKAWLHSQDEEGQRKDFARLNPIAHELTHYVLDHLTSGNYTRWFSEGFAQWVEYNATGYLWIEPASTLRQPLYSLSDLRDRFDSLRNQPLAYRQSYLLVKYLVESYGEERLSALIAQLAAGVTFDRAVERVYLASMEEIYSAWMNWVAAHRDRLERER